MYRNFHLSRNLSVGMVGDDVRRVQYWLNLVNFAYSFSHYWRDGIPENGKFQTYIMGTYLHEYLDWAGYDRSHVYDNEIHEWLCSDVNYALRYAGDTATTWTCY